MAKRKGYFGSRKPRKPSTVETKDATFCLSDSPHDVDAATAERHAKLAAFLVAGKFKRSLLEETGCWMGTTGDYTGSIMTPEAARGMDEKTFHAMADLCVGNDLIASCIDGQIAIFDPQHTKQIFLIAEWNGYSIED